MDRNSDEKQTSLKSSICIPNVNCHGSGDTIET